MSLSPALSPVFGLPRYFKFIGDVLSAPLLFEEGVGLEGRGGSHCHGVSFRVNKGRREVYTRHSIAFDRPYWTGERARISNENKLAESMKDAEKKNGRMSSTGRAKVWN